MGLLAAFGVSLFLSGCGLIEEVDGPRREDFALSPTTPQQDQNGSPVTASDVDRGELMQLDVLRELQRRGRFFYEMFPGAKASDAWQRQREEHEQGEMGFRCSRPEADDRPQGLGTENSN